MDNFFHRPVLLDECIAGLNIRPDGIYIDGTLGGGGHSEAILGLLTTGLLIGVDRDETAISAAKQRLERFGRRFLPVHGNFRDVAAVAAEYAGGPVDGMLFDLGVSSPQLDRAERGFSYMADAPLDMRMDQSRGMTAAEMVNTYGEKELADILWRYGEERYSRRIAAAIVRERENGGVETTGCLTEIIKSAMPGSALREKQHPAKRSFQALRIAVNDELGALEQMLAEAPDMLRPGGRIAVISFHSLEDRMVKTAFRARERGCTCPPDLPVCVCGFKQTLKTLGGAITASRDELDGNPRSRSAKLRIAERTDGEDRK